MKKLLLERSWLVAVAAVISLLLPVGSAFGAFDSGSTGTTAFAPQANIEVELPPDGVLQYTTVNIPAGVTVTFKKNANNTGVTILASGDVTIDGIIDVSGKDANGVLGGYGGPGGFKGGSGGVTMKNGNRGEGPGGGGGGLARNEASYSGGGGGAGYSSSGSNGGNGGIGGLEGIGGSSYGNERILPIIGGSGGGGGGGNNTRAHAGSGGGGGGAILIASSGTINITGAIKANGGSGSLGADNCVGLGGGGSGGSIRLLANIITGEGTVTANYGAGRSSSCTAYDNGGNGAYGRIRLEAMTINRAAMTTPVYSPGYPYAVMPPGMPSLKIVSAGNVAAPGNPLGVYAGTDIILSTRTTNPVKVVIQGGNIPVGTTVTLKALPELGSITTATGILSGTLESSSVEIPITISSKAPSILLASVTYELLASNGGPVYAEGEAVKFVRVEAGMEGKTVVTYITETGREVLAKL